MKRATKTREFPYVPNKDYYVVGPRSAWDIQPVGLFNTFDDAHRAFPLCKADIVRKATTREIEIYFGLVEE